MRKRLLTPLLLVAPLALAACGGDDGATTTTTPIEADLTVRAVPSISWDSPTYTVAAGDVTVALVNDEGVFHELTILSGNAQVDPNFVLDINKKGDVATGTITLAPGEYRVFCLVPGHSNMDSVLTVS